MLLKYKASNFCSFKNEFNFSMKPGKVMKRFEDNVIMANSKFKVSKVAVIVGENAGGKTCFMRSLDFFKYLITKEGGVNSLKQLCYMYNNKEAQNFEITVLAENDKIYTYNLSIDSKSIVLEQLKIRNLNQSEREDKTIFTIKREEFTKISENTYDIVFDPQLDNKFFSNEEQVVFQKKFSGSGKESSDGLFISIFNKLEIDIVKPFVKWINEKLIVETPSNVSLNIYKRMEKNEEDLKIMHDKNFLDIFSLVDPSIIKLEIDEKDPFRESTVIRKGEGGAEFKIKLKYDSSGVNEFLAWSIQIWKVIYRDVTLFADEIDRVLNPILSAKIIAYIKGSEHKGQFVFTTHNVLHINTEDFMKEQIYFVNKDSENISSEMYSLADFPDYRYDKIKVYELYLKGLLGGVPNE